MKKVVALLAGMGLLVAFAPAQDVIVLKNTDEIQAKILEIAPNTIKYVEWDAQDGPSRIIDKGDIFVIKYQNGKKESFAEFPAEEQTTEARKRDATERPYIKRIKPQGYVYFGAAIGKNAMITAPDKPGAGPAIDASFGARFRDYFYLGLEVEYACLFQKESVFWTDKYGNYNVMDVGMCYHTLSAGVNMKGYLPVTAKFFPYLNLSLGVNVLPLDGCFHYEDYEVPGYEIYGVGQWSYRKIGFDMKFGAGIDYGRLSFGAGYHLIEHGLVHLGYIKVGVRL